MLSLVLKRDATDLLGATVFLVSAVLLGVRVLLYTIPFLDNIVLLGIGALSIIAVLLCL